MKTVSAPELRGLLQANASRQPALLDVREDWEVVQAPLRVDSVPTLHIPMSQIPSRRAELDGLQPVIAFCHHGMRSAQVVAFLMQHGLTDVYNLSGGIDAWSTLVDPGVPRY
jgi:rhodanese-related sulfurtransferase